MKHLNAYLLVFSSIFLLLTWTSVSDARPHRPALLPDGGANFACLTCHIVPGGPRNLFGQDYEAIGLAAGDMYTAELGNIDSDGDGFTNDEEFNANPVTDPSNPDSRPAVVAVEAKGKKRTLWATLKNVRSIFGRAVSQKPPTGNTTFAPQKLAPQHLEQIHKRILAEKSTRQNAA